MASSAIELLLVSLPQLAKGAGQTLAISALGIVFATLGGVLYGVLATLGKRAVNIALQVYLELFRAIPVLVWLYLVFFGLPIFFSLSIPSFWCAVLVLGLWGASEVGEVVRGALASLPRGQREAGLSIAQAHDATHHQYLHTDRQDQLACRADRRRRRHQGRPADHRAHLRVGADLRRAVPVLLFHLLPAFRRLARAGTPLGPLMSALIEFQGFNKFFGEHQVLKDVDLQVQAGEVVVILGPSGCGKSTLLRCLNGLEEAHGGSLRLDGQELLGSGTDWRQVRQRVGMVFQSYHLFGHMSVIDNLLLGPLKVQKRERAEAQAQAEALLARVGLLDKRDAFPRQLSGGQQQRIAIVRSLCMNPQVMLFDEVTAALDPEMVKEVLQVIQGLARDGMTLLIVTHEMAFARAVADRIVFMEAGRILEQSDPESFFSQPRTARAQQFLDKFSFVESLPKTLHKELS